MKPLSRKLIIRATAVAHAADPRLTEPITNARSARPEVIAGIQWRILDSIYETLLKAFVKP
jgi:hypothetical protein